MSSKFNIDIPKKEEREREDNKIKGMQDFVYIGIDVAGNR